VAQGIINWVDALLSDPKHGGFYASQDADINLHDDGDHFTWSPRELQEILSAEEFETARLYYNVHERGDMPHAEGRNVLTVSRPLTEITHELSLPLGQVEADLASAQGKMREARRQRPTPFVDQTRYVNWNGMMTAAYFEAADLLELPDVRAFAEKSLERTLADFYRKGHEVLHGTGIGGFLEDYAWLAWAALKGHASTGKVHYLNVARDITEMMIGKFEDERLGGFFDLSQTEQPLALLQFKRKPIEDNPSSSANAMALRVLQTLSLITEDSIYEESLARGLNMMVSQNGHYGLFVSALALTALHRTHAPLKLEVAGTDHELQARARGVFYPGKVLSYLPREAASEIRVCVGTQCLAPAKTADALGDCVRTLVPTSAGCTPL
jgi:uncharacterized protein YyaL (SSP411 family)